MHTQISKAKQIIVMYIQQKMITWLPGVPVLTSGVIQGELDR